MVDKHVLLLMLGVSLSPIASSRLGLSYRLLPSLATRGRELIGGAPRLVSSFLPRPTSVNLSTVSPVPHNMGASKKKTLGHWLTIVAFPCQSAEGTLAFVRLLPPPVHERKLTKVQFSRIVSFLKAVSTSGPRSRQP